MQQQLRIDDESLLRLSFSHDEEIPREVSQLMYGRSVVSPVEGGEIEVRFEGVNSILERIRGRMKLNRRGRRFCAIAG